jgi:hypothetical protein
MGCLLQPIYKRAHQTQSSSDQDPTSFNNEICGANKRKQEPRTSKGNVTSESRIEHDGAPISPPMHKNGDSRWMGLGGRRNVKQSRSRWCSPGFSRLPRRPVQFLPRDAGGSGRRRLLYLFLFLPFSNYNNGAPARGFSLTRCGSGRRRGSRGNVGAERRRVGGRRGRGRLGGHRPLGHLAGLAAASRRGRSGAAGYGVGEAGRRHWQWQGGVPPLGRWRGRGGRCCFAYRNVCLEAAEPNLLTAR